MADIMIVKQSANSVDMICGKKQAQIYRSSQCGYINVICKNAAHKAWKGGGNYFHDSNCWEQALGHYKSPEMRAMINEAKSLIS